jgi:hypothetical protein
VTHEDLPEKVLQALRAVYEDKESLRPEDAEFERMILPPGHRLPVEGPPPRDGPLKEGIGLRGMASRIRGRIQEGARNVPGHDGPGRGGRLALLFLIQPVVVKGPSPRDGAALLLPEGGRLAGRGRVQGRRPATIPAETEEVTKEATCWT